MKFTEAWNAKDIQFRIDELQRAKIELSNRMIRAQAFREAAGIVLGPKCTLDIVLGPKGTLDEVPEEHDEAIEWGLRTSLATLLILKAEGEQEDW
jgi:hypothetical protein